MYINEYKLDEYQMESIRSNHEATLVIAGAGSGKTLTILGKIKYLISNNYKENEILCISFTNETTISLKNKIKELGYNVDVYTFHKLSLTFLNNNYKIVDNNYLKYIIDEYFKSYIKYNKSRNRTLKSILYLDNKIYETDEYKNLIKTIITFIRLSKSNDFSINELFKIYKKCHFNEKQIMRIIIEIYKIYKEELESTNQIDFDDMLILAKEKVKYKKLNYKYIIIDEFQDTSKVRFNLILEIIKYTNAKLFVVGDDYQSIYRFSGCDLNLFLNFKNYFKDVRYYYLKYTYRNSNQLIKVSVSFIMKNKKQLNKNIESIKNNNKPIKIVKNKNLEDIIKIVDKDFLIIGRNNSDINNIKYSNKLTIHKSKGLEANDIILVNSDSIPTRIKNENILRFVLNTKEYIIHEEERRLFYVALTRCKNNIYIMVNKKMSPFVKELISNYSKYIEIIS